MISKKINLTGDNDGGFYYDEQLDNEMFRATLHPSTEDGPPDEFSQPKNGPLSNYYHKDPIATAVISDDFQVSITNDFSSFGGDAIGGFWNEVVKPLQPYVDYVKDDANYLIQRGTELVEKFTNRIGSPGIKKAVSTVTDTVKTISNEISRNPGAILKRSLIVQGTMFSYFKNTELSFGNLMMKYVVFSGYDKNGSYVTVQDQINKLRFYIIGNMKPLASGHEQDLKQFAMWQLPPGGYKTNLFSIDSKQYGTLLLKLGPFYSIPNLVVQGAQLNYSKILAKNPNVGDSTQLDPLYCEVTLMLKPVTKFSADALFNFAHGIDSKPERTDFENKLKGRLSALKGINNGLGMDKM